MKRRILILTLLLLQLYFLQSISFAEFNIQSIKILEPEVIKQTVILKKDTSTNKKLLIKQQEIKELKKENTLLKDKISELQFKIENLLKLIYDPIVPPIEDVIPIEDANLNKKQLSSLTYKEPRNIANLNIFQRIDIYNSRVSKAAEKIMQNKVEFVVVDLKLLSLSLFDILELPESEIAYSENIYVIPTTNKAGILESVVIKRKVD